MNASSASPVLPLGCVAIRRASDRPLDDLPMRPAD
jgi:hypothetical protein